MQGWCRAGYCISMCKNSVTLSCPKQTNKTTTHTTTHKHTHAHTTDIQTDIHTPFHTPFTMHGAHSHRKARDGNIWHKNTSDASNTPNTPKTVTEWGKHWGTHHNISQHINTSTHQHINASIHRHNVINTSTHQRTNTSTHQHINPSTHQHINTSSLAAGYFRQVLRHRFRKSQIFHARSARTVLCYGSFTPSFSKIPNFFRSACSNSSETAVRFSRLLKHKLVNLPVVPLVKCHKAKSSPQRSG